MELIEATSTKSTKATTKAAKKFNFKVNERAIMRFLLRALIAVGIIVAGAAVWFCIGEAFPALRQQMPNFYSFVDLVLKLFDNLYAFLK